jgi:hypothetical protein
LKVSFTLAIAALVFCNTSCRDEIESEVTRSAFVSATDRNSPLTSDANLDRLRKHLFDELENRGRYRRPSTAELERAVQLCSATLSEESNPNQLRSMWEAAGFKLDAIEEGGESFWVLKELENEKFGRGIVAFRRSQSVPVMFQAPHSFYDLDSDEIALQLFVLSRARVCFWNTIHRRVANLTEEEDSFLNALSIAFARTTAQGRVIQIHGFSQTPQHERFGRRIDLIISQGTEEPSQNFLRFAQEVRRGCDPFETAIFPLDVNELGGVKNRQRKVLLAEELTDFVHCEMSPAFRRELLADRDLADRVGRELTRLELNPEID